MPECQEYHVKNILDTISQKCGQNVLSFQAGFVLSCWYLEGTCTSLSKIWYFAQMQRLRRVKFRYRSTLSNCAGRAIENVLRLYFVRLAADCAENTTPGNPWLLLQFYIPQWFATVPHCFEASVQLVPTISFTSCLQRAWTAVDFYRTQVSLVRSLCPDVRPSGCPSDTLLRLNWCDSGWWGYQLNTNW